MYHIKKLGRQLIIGLIAFGCLTAGIVSASGIFNYTSNTLNFKDSLTVNEEHAEQLDSANGDNTWVSNSNLKYVIGESSNNNIFQINNGDNLAVLRFIADPTASLQLFLNGSKSMTFEAHADGDAYAALKPGSGEGSNSGLRVLRATNSTDYATLGLRNLADSQNAAAFIGYNSDDKGLFLLTDGATPSVFNEARFIGTGTSSLSVNGVVKLGSNLSLEPASTSPSGVVGSWLAVKDGGSVGGELKVQQLYVQDYATNPGMTPPNANAPVSKQWVLDQDFIKVNPDAGVPDLKKWVPTGDVPWANVDGAPSPFTLPPSKHAHQTVVLWWYGCHGFGTCGSSSNHVYTMPWSTGSVSYANLLQNYLNKNISSAGTPDSCSPGVASCQVYYKCPIVTHAQDSQVSADRQSYIVLHNNSIDTTFMYGVDTEKYFAGQNNSSFWFEVACAYERDTIIDLDGTP